MEFTLLIFLLFFFQTVVTSAVKVAHIAPAYDASLNDGWARFVYWQAPNGTIFVNNRVNKTTTEILSPYTPKKNSPLAAFSIGTEGSDNQITVSFLDKYDHMVEVTCHHNNDLSYYDWSSGISTQTSASGLAIARAKKTTRRLFVNEVGYISQQIGNETALQLGPKAAKGSQLSLAVAANSTALHLFYVAEDKSLSSITYNDTTWSTYLPPIEDFSADEKISFAAAAWADPPAVRVFYVDKDKDALTEYTLAGPYDDTAAWTSQSYNVGKDTVLFTGEPVAISRAENGTGRYLEYYYNAKDGNDDTSGQINYFATNHVEYETFTIQFATFDIHIDKWSRSDKIAIGTGISSTVVAILLVWFNRKWIKRIYGRRRRNSMPGTSDQIQLGRNRGYSFLLDSEHS